MGKEAAFDLPEETKLEIINKIEAFADKIRSDWTDPRSEIKNIKRLCDKLRSMEYCRIPA